MIKITSKLLAELPDGVFRVDKGLYIRTRNGKQAYIFIYTFKKKKHELRIGDVTLITPTIARAKAIEYRSKLEQGIDPIKERTAENEPTDSETLTFKKFLPYALDKISETKQWRNPKSYGQWKSSLETYAVPIIGKKPLRSIKREDIIEVLTPIWKTKTETASRLQGRIEAIFNLAIVMKLYDEMNPAIWKGNLSFFLPPKSSLQSGSVGIETMYRL